ncbi:hypothetical protein DFH27DRAFT_576176 [Peziza echinospora]|nr:hypothetical protein DFH27DRAFT_576176 [Peziza echinospora]
MLILMANFGRCSGRFRMARMNIVACRGPTFRQVARANVPTGVCGLDPNGSAGRDISACLARWLAGSVGFVLLAGRLGDVIDVNYSGITLTDNSSRYVPTTHNQRAHSLATLQLDERDCAWRGGGGQSTRLSGCPSAYLSFTQSVWLGGWPRSVCWLGWHEPGDMWRVGRRGVCYMMMLVVMTMMMLAMMMMLMMMMMKYAHVCMYLLL